MSQSRLNLILKIFTPDAGAAFWNRSIGVIVRGEGSVAALDHEVGDYAVEGGVIVGTTGAEGEEVLGCRGNGFAEDFDFERAVSGVEGY